MLQALISSRLQTISLPIGLHHPILYEANDVARRDTNRGLSVIGLPETLR